jgi:hypothetical protein
MLPILFNVTANSTAYTGSLNVVVKDVNQTVVYVGSASTWSSTISVLRYPMSIVVTPNATWQVYT